MAAPLPAGLLTSPFLRLPAELRNQIYSYALEDENPLVATPGSQMRSETYQSLGLLRACRSIYSEAASTFYAKNTFLIELPCGEGTIPDFFDGFLDAIGLHARMVRKVIVSLNSRRWDVFGTSCSSKEWFLFPNTIRVTQFLQTIWRRQLTINIDFRDERPTGIQDEGAFTNIFRSLQTGALKVRKYSQLVEEVGIKDEGTGGTIFWGSLAQSSNIWRRTSLDRINVVDFVATDLGNRLQLQAPNVALSLMTLPEPVRHRIFEMVCHPEGGVEIDVDKDTSFPCGLIFVNKELYRDWREPFLFENSLVLHMSTTERRTTFSNFSKLRRLLRKTFTLETWDGAVVIKTLACATDALYTVSLNLNFHVDESVSLSDLRICILPFVMETSSMSGKDYVTINLFPRVSKSTTQRIRLQTLRTNAAKAITDIAYLARRPGAAEIWTNGHCDVVSIRVHPTHESISPSREALHFASRISGVCTGGPYSVQELHPKDALYRGHARRYESIVHPRCRFWEYGQFFPFPHAPREALRYLLWVLDFQRGEYVSDAIFSAPPFVCSCEEGECEREEE